MLRHLDLFSGIGGFALAARMVGGYETVAFCEIEPYCQAVLRKHWPGVPIYDDVRSVQRIECDIITGGFPCQPFSSASRGRRNGTEDDRFLWPEMLRVVKACRPACVLCENVTHIDSVALEQVVSDLDSIGYETQTFEVPACAVGFDHRRTRYWILGHTHCDGESELRVNAEVAGVQGRQYRPGGMGETHGLSRRLDTPRARLAALGNAIVPAIAAIFLQAIKDCDLT
jgi:Site-specific DNA methylase